MRANLLHSPLLLRRRSIMHFQRLAAAALSAMAPAFVAAQQGPIRVGALLELTGVFAPNGQDALDGLQLYFDEIKHQAGGRKIELIVEDTAGKPDLGLTKARKLVENDKV